MQTPIQITIRSDIKHSAATEAHIHEKAKKLDKYFDNIIDSQIVIDWENKNQHSGNLYTTCITLTVPNKALVSNGNEFENLFSSIDSAFEDITRQLEEYANLLHKGVKNPVSLLSGKIVRLFHQDGFGFIESDDGTEFYFNANDTSHPAFHQLVVGMPVHFAQGMGTNGPQAHRVKSVSA